jgi:hypothetical protein
MIRGAFLTRPIDQDTITRLKALGVNQVALGWEACQEGRTQQLRDQGIQVYAEISLFVGEALWEKYPDSRPVGRDGRLMEPVKWYYGVCPNHPGVRAEKLTQVESILDGVTVDGLWLDFIRYPCHWEAARGSLVAEYCFCPHCLGKFEAEVDGKPQGEAWIAWKCAQIAGFVGQIRSRIKKSGRSLSLGLFAVPWSAADYGGAIRSVIGQDFSILAEHVDVFGVMAYHRLIDRPVDWIGAITREVSRISGKAVLPLVQSMDEPEKISGIEFERALHTAVQEPSGGVMVFHYEDMLQDEVKCDIFGRELEA